MKVSRLPKDPGPAAWNAILAPTKPVIELENTTTADWVVIGAGFAGLSAARQLSLLHPSDRIVVLEASRIAEGPAGRNSGFMIDLPHDLASNSYSGAIEKDRLQTQANRLAISFAADMVKAFDLPAEAFSPIGKINAAATPNGHRHNLDYAAHLVAMNEPHELLDADAMEDLTGIDYYSGGLFTPGSVMLQPALYIRGLASGLRSNRVTIYENSPVTEMERRGPDWRLYTPKGKLTAPKVILAVNGHANSFGYFQDRLMHVFTYASMTRALGDAEIASIGGDASWGVTPADPLGTTVRKVSGIGGTRIIIRNRFTYDPDLEVSSQKLDRVTRTHDASFAARFPTLKAVEMEYRWGGRLCLSRNNVHAFGEVDDGVYSACCQNGLGTTKGTLTGMLAAQLASGVYSPTLKALQRMEKPSRLLPSPIMRFGARVRLGVGEFRAGREL